MNISQTGLLLCLLLVAACSKSADVYEELPNSSLAGAPRDAVPETQMESTLARRVTIGEDGARFAACGTTGRVTRPGAQGLVVRTAPFAEAKAIMALAEGERLFVCTRSLDQKWLGVVVIPTPAATAGKPLPAVAAPDTDCGVSGPVEREQPYEGPCVSGWVASAYVRLVAG